jgi:hypothetical protein
MPPLAQHRLQDWRHGRPCRSQQLQKLNSCPPDSGGLGYSQLSWPCCLRCRAVPAARFCHDRHSPIGPNLGQLFAAVLLVAADRRPEWSGSRRAACRRPEGRGLDARSGGRRLPRRGGRRYGGSVNNVAAGQRRCSLWLRGLAAAAGPAPQRRTPGASGPVNAHTAHRTPTVTRGDSSGNLRHLVRRHIHARRWWHP